MQDLVVDHSKRSIANDVNELKPHTDETYSASPPGLLLIQCVEPDVAGAGASIILDGFGIAEILKHEDPEGFLALANNRQPFRRYFSGGNRGIGAEICCIAATKGSAVCVNYANSGDEAQHVVAARSANIADREWTVVFICLKPP